MACIAFCICGLFLGIKYLVGIYNIVENILSQKQKELNEKIKMEDEYRAVVDSIDVATTVEDVKLICDRISAFDRRYLYMDKCATYVASMHTKLVNKQTYIRNLLSPQNYN